MNRFDEIVEEIGWTKPFDSVPLWLREDDGNGYMTAAFETSYDNYARFKDSELVDEKFVRSVLYAHCCHTKFEAKNKEWILYMLAADFYGHRQNTIHELIWARKAMLSNPKLKSNTFSRRIREKLDSL